MLRIESLINGVWEKECNCEDAQDAADRLKEYQDNYKYPVRIAGSEQTEEN